MTSSALSLRQATTDVGVFEIIEQSSPAPSSRRVDGTLPLDTAEWASFLDSEGRIHSVNELMQRVYAGGIAPALRRSVPSPLPPSPCCTRPAPPDSVLPTGLSMPPLCCCRTLPV